MPPNTFDFFPYPYRHYYHSIVPVVQGKKNLAFIFDFSFSYIETEFLKNPIAPTYKI